MLSFGYRGVYVDLNKYRKICDLHGPLVDSLIYVKPNKGWLECKLCRKFNRVNHADKYKAEYMVKMRVELRDPYVRDSLRHKGFRKKDITPELIEVERLRLTLVRKIREIMGTYQYGNKYHQ